MIICHSRRFILFSNPKTGSESLRHLFANWSEEEVVPYRHRTDPHQFYPHMPPAEAAAAFAQKGLNFGDYERVTMVRNPFDRLVSLYRMIAEVDGLWRLRRGFGLGQQSFPNWLASTRPDGRGGGGREHQRWRRFGTWSAEAWCAGKITHVVRLEHLAQDLAPVLTALDLAPGAMPHVNARPPIRLEDYYDPHSIALVRRRYASDLRTFGYDISPSLAHAA
jgi:hypothetical protein